MRNVPHSLGHLSAWSPAGGAVWGGLMSEALLWKVCQHRWALIVQRLCLVHYVYHMLAVQDVSPQPPAAVPAVLFYHPGLQAS